MKLHYGDLTDSTCLVKIISEVKPTEIYNLGAQSHVKVSRVAPRLPGPLRSGFCLWLLDAAVQPLSAPWVESSVSGCHESPRARGSMRTSAPRSVGRASDFAAHVQLAAFVPFG